MDSKLGTVLKHVLPPSCPESAPPAGSPLSQIHTELSECLSISPPPVPWEPTLVPQAASLSSRAPWLAESVRNCIQLQTHTFICRCGTINRSAAASRDQTLTVGTSAAQRAAMAPTITAALTKAQEQPALAHKVNWRSSKTPLADASVYVDSGLSLVLICSYFCSSGSLWWKSYAERESTAALSSSSRSWVQSSSTSNQTPSWKKPTSWRWQSASSGSCSSRIGPWALQLWNKAIPDVSRRWASSCPGSGCRLRQDWSSTSTSCSLQLLWPCQRWTCLLCARQHGPVPPKARQQRSRATGDPGRRPPTGRCWSQGWKRKLWIMQRCCLKISMSPTNE